MPAVAMDAQRKRAETELVARATCMDALQSLPVADRVRTLLVLCALDPRTRPAAQVLRGVLEGLEAHPLAWEEG